MAFPHTLQSVGFPSLLGFPTLLAAQCRLSRPCCRTAHSCGVLPPAPVAIRPPEASRVAAAVTADVAPVERVRPGFMRVTMEGQNCGEKKQNRAKTSELYFCVEDTMKITLKVCLTL